MITVSFSPECIQFMRDLGIPPDRAMVTINEPHQGLVSLNRVIAAHWFGDNDIVLVESLVKDRKVDNERERFWIIAVEAQLVIPLRSVLPAGTFTRETPMEQILAVVAESFGQQVIGSPDSPPTKLYTGPWDNEKNRFRANEEDSTFFSGTFCPDENRCELVWMFSMERYQQWLAESSKAEPVPRVATPSRVAVEPLIGNGVRSCNRTL